MKNSILKVMFNSLISKFFLLFLMFAYQLTGAQLSTEHYIAPIWKAGDAALGTITLELTTNVVTPFNFTIRRGDGFLLQSGIISSALPYTYNVGSNRDPNNPAMSYRLTQAFIAQTDKGLIEEAEQPVIANLRQVTALNDLWSITSKGIQGKGRSFRTGHKYDTGDSAAFNSSHGFSVFATEPGVTTINVDVNGLAVFLNGTRDQTISLNQGEVYTFVANAEGIGENEDLNGTLVTSDKDITVTSGSFITWHATAGDSGFDQILPVPIALNSNFILLYGKSLPLDSYAEVVNVVAHSNNTEVWQDGVSQGVINAGENMRLFFTVRTPGEHMVVTTREMGTSTDGSDGVSRGVIMYQDSGGSYGETGMAAISGLDCSGSLSTQFVYLSDIANIYIVSKQGSIIVLNGTTLTSTDLVPVLV